MRTINEKFQKLGVDNAPGQEVRQKAVELELIGEKLEGVVVDFSHGDVNAHPPIPGSFETFKKGFELGAEQAYTEYRGAMPIRDHLAAKLTEFVGIPVSAQEGLLITPGTQGALFLALGANVGAGDKVAIIEPDYFANRKIVEFFDGEIVPIQMDYLSHDSCAGISLSDVEQAFKSGVKLMLFSNPNNPTGVIYSKEEIETIAKLANKYNVTLIVDELYSRQIFENREYTHLCATGLMNSDNLVTIIGPSKTESLSGFRLGVAYGAPAIISRMEKLQAIVSLRAGGYSQAAMYDWFAEPQGWLEARILEHQAIRDGLVELWKTVEGGAIRTTQGGSYIFPRLPKLKVSLVDFVKILRVHAGVIVTPGTEFGPQFTDSIRLNFSQDHDKAMDAMKRIMTMVERYRA